MGIARKKLLKAPPLTRPLSGEEALQVALLGTCQITLRALFERLELESSRHVRERRTYWLNKMAEAIEGVDLTLDGWVNPEFELKFNKYHKLIEGDIQSLLKTYKEVD